MLPDDRKQVLDDCLARTADACPFKGIAPPLAKDDIAYLNDVLAGRPEEQRALNLREAMLDGAQLNGVDLRRAELSQATLRGARLEGAHLEGARLKGARLEKAKLSTAFLLDKACLDDAHLEGADLAGAQMDGASLKQAQMQGADLTKAHLAAVTLDSANLTGVRGEGVDLRGASLVDVDLEHAHLAYATLTAADLKRADMREANLEGACLAGAVLDNATFDARSNLAGTCLSSDVATCSARPGHGCSLNLVLAGRPREATLVASVADTAWNGVNLASVRWGRLFPGRGRSWTHIISSDAPGIMLGDEQLAYPEIVSGAPAPKARTKFIALTDTQREQFSRAVRAYRQLSVTLLAQGLHEESAYLAYRGLVVRRNFVLPPRGWSYVESRTLDHVAGYGYMLGKCVRTYAEVQGFSIALYLLIGLQNFAATGRHLPTGSTAPQAAWAAFLEACILSVTSFHGRAFLPGSSGNFVNNVPLPTNLMFGTAAAVEGVVGLGVEAIIVATLVQRYIGKQ